ncbi:acetylornithine/succinyldiaminopimelate/putrescine aminotransferase [Neolewinella xylanilytica]|uniref:Acetylornithine/succinyldiaminopimelate/putresci ne aminotransferase n=1 Tax=Neolewinella xylanilytica TaxID=1514080 RepID=A0A2S6I8H2_9BACT|nr:aspartate aminotransferase family protein [Neolewinella xylanilytica]PPK87807.1 acetylornithine/succinyldiaminopimelate/putrescine aminotransferase [Neolewinella xylanilytica]
MRANFLKHVAQTSPAPMGLEIAGGEGVYLIDANGKRYLDLIAGIGVSALGHNHPAVVEAVQRQAGTYMHTLVYGEFVLSTQVELATLLCAQLPESLDNVYFTNSGTEAVEGAMKLAKRITGRTGFVSATRSYHGSTQGAASLMWPKDFTRPFHPLLPGVTHLDFNCDHCLGRITTDTAAVILETVQAEWGIRKPRPEWIHAVRRRCDETGALLILDEIQAGMGRTGTLFAFEQYGIVPDILLLAKGFGGGMPLGAFVASRKLMETLTVDPVLGHITTFGGHPVSCAAGLAVLRELIDRPEHIRSVPEKEALVHRLLVHPKIRHLRSAGLWMAVELDDFDEVRRVIAGCLERGLITDWFLWNERSLRIAPPLTISEAELEWACGVILEALAT